MNLVSVAKSDRSIVVVTLHEIVDQSLVRSVKGGMKSGGVFVHSVRELRLLTSRRDRRAYALAYCLFQKDW